MHNQLLTESVKQLLSLVESTGDRTLFYRGLDKMYTESNRFVLEEVASAYMDSSILDELDDLPKDGLLEFTIGNTKLNDDTLIFSLPAGYTCPGAVNCIALAKPAVGKFTRKGKQAYTIEDTKHYHKLHDYEISKVADNAVRLPANAEIAKYNVGGSVSLGQSQLKSIKDLKNHKIFKVIDIIEEPEGVILVLDGEVPDGYTYINYDSSFDMKNLMFKCFAAMDERNEAPRDIRWWNFALLKRAERDGGTDAMTKLIVASIAQYRGKFVRIHTAGDFFSDKYYKAWVEAAKYYPQMTFYAYTKSAPFVNMEELPSNFIITSSEGSRYDEVAKAKNIPTARVFLTPEAAIEAGLPIDFDDSFARKPYTERLSRYGTPNFALLVHGGQKEGTIQARGNQSEANKAFLFGMYAADYGISSNIQAFKKVLKGKGLKVDDTGRMLKFNHKDFVNGWNHYFVQESKPVTKSSDESSMMSREEYMKMRRKKLNQ